MDIDTQRLTKSQFRQASHFQKVQQATLNENLRGLSAEYAVRRHQTARETARLRLKAESLQELASRRTNSSRRPSPLADPNRCNNSLQVSSTRLSVSMNDLHQAALLEQLDHQTAQRSRDVHASSARCSSDKRRSPNAASSTSDVTTYDSRSPPGDATLVIPRLQVSPDSIDLDESLEQYEGLKKCRYLRVRGLDEEELTTTEVFAKTTAGDRESSASQ